MLEAHASGGAVVVEVAVSKLWEEREDFIPCGLIQGVPSLFARVETLRRTAFSVDDLVGIKEHVEILHLTPFFTQDGLVIQQRLGCGQYFQFPTEHLCLPALQEHTVLWTDARVTVIPKSTLADQNGGKIACSCAGVSWVAASDRACFGRGWTSTNKASMPTAARRAWIICSKSMR